MKIVAKHKFAPLVALEDGSVIDTEELEVIGNGSVSGSRWEFNVQDMELDPRWEEIARADQASLSVNQKKANSGERTFRAPKVIRDELAKNGVETPLAAGSGLTLQELEDLINQDGVEGLVLDWVASTLNKHQENPQAPLEDSLFAEAEPHLDYDAIDAAIDAMDNEPPGNTVVAAGENAKVSDPPPGQFNKIVYLAIVEQDDTESVQDLIALVQTPSGSADAYSYVGGTKGWKEAAKTLTELQSTAPPPIIQLADWQVNSIIQQINGATGKIKEDDTPDAAPVQASAFELPEATILWGPDNKTILSIVAAGKHGGIDPAERLRQYWEHGEGAAKIRWAPDSGSWRRCVRHLSKYLGPERSKGYCAIRMHHVLGIWPGSRANGGHGGHR